MDQDLRFKAKEVARITGRAPLTIAHIGQLIEAEVPGNGKGNHSLYSFRNLVEVRLVEYLGKFGIPQKRIQKYIEDLRKSNARWLEEYGADGWIVLDNLWRWGAGETIQDAISALKVTGLTPIGLISINLGAIKRSLRLSIERNTVFPEA